MAETSGSFSRSPSALFPFLFWGRVPLRKKGQTSQLDNLAVVRLQREGSQGRENPAELGHFPHAPLAPKPLMCEAWGLVLFGFSSIWWLPKAIRFRGFLDTILFTFSRGSEGSPVNIENGDPYCEKAGQRTPVYCETDLDPVYSWR